MRKQLRSRILVQKTQDHAQLEAIKDSVQLAADQVREVWIRVLREKVDPKPTSLAAVLFEVFITVVPYSKVALPMAGAVADAVIGRILRTRLAFYTLPKSKAGKRLFHLTNVRRPDNFPNNPFRKAWEKRFWDLKLHNGEWLNKIGDARALYHPAIRITGDEAIDYAFSAIPTAVKVAKKGVATTPAPSIGLGLDEPAVRLTRSVVRDIRAQQLIQSMVWDSMLHELEPPTTSTPGEPGPDLEAINVLLRHAEIYFRASKALELQQLHSIGQEGMTATDLRALQYEFTIWRTYFPRWSVAASPPPIPAPTTHAATSCA